MKLIRVLAKIRVDFELFFQNNFSCVCFDPKYILNANLVGTGLVVGTLQLDKELYFLYTVTTCRGHISRVLGCLENCKKLENPKAYF